MRVLEGLDIVASPLSVPGKKTGSTRAILECVPKEDYERWIEPFAGSCVVGFTERPTFAVFADILPYGMQFFSCFKQGELRLQEIVRSTQEFARELTNNPKRYNEIRDRFKKNRDPLDYFLLSFFCRNGMMEFTKDGACTSTFGRIPLRKLAQLESSLEKIYDAMTQYWEFSCAPWRVTLRQIDKNDLVYIDPPNLLSRFSKTCWNAREERDLRTTCFALPCSCMVSLWLEREGVYNSDIHLWEKEGFIRHEIPVRLHHSTKGMDVLLVRA